MSDLLPIKIVSPTGLAKNTKIVVGEMDITQHVKSLVLTIDAKTQVAIVHLGLVRVELDSDVLAALHVDRYELAETIAEYQAMVASKV